MFYLFTVFLKPRTKLPSVPNRDCHLDMAEGCAFASIDHCFSNASQLCETAQWSSFQVAARVSRLFRPARKMCRRRNETLIRGPDETWLADRLMPDGPAPFNSRAFLVVVDILVCSLTLP